MANRLGIITDLYEETLSNISNNEESWMSFLECAAMNYKYPFNDQVLIYAQKPTAIACAKIEAWNKQVGRWVNKGAKGIALFTEEDGYTRLRYVFDVADTNSRNGKSFRLWSVPKPYELDIIESLENKYGELDNKSSLALAIKSVSKIIVEDNLQDYLEDLMLYRDNSSLEALEEDNVKEVFKTILENCIAFSMIKRCGLNPNEYFTKNDFKEIVKFDSYETISRLGIASSEISEMGIREIYTTIKNLRINEINKIYTFDEKGKYNYDRGDRRNENENNLYQTGRLRDAELDSTRERDSSGGQIRDNEIEIFEGEQKISLHNSVNEKSTSTTFDGDSRNSRDESRTNSERYGSERKSDREFETTRSNEMGTTNEQFKNDSRGDSDKRIDLQLNIYNKTNDISYVVVDEKINQILSTTPHLKKSNKEIKEFFKNEPDIKKRTKFLQSIFNDDYTGVIVDDQMYWYKTYDNGILFGKGKSFSNRTAESLVSWQDLTYHYDSMILLNQLNDKREVLPSVFEQLSFLNDNSEQTVSDLEFTQEFIDSYLTEKDRETKFEIYEMFQKSYSTEDNITFLKNLYGIGGSSSILRNSGIGENYDAKGIRFNRGYFDKSSVEQLFKWDYIEKRIKTLIKEERYLNPKELEEYPKWLEEKEQAEESVEESEKIDSSIPESSNKKYEYQYHLGDKVYIGADEYEILTIGDLNVVLYDYRYPLFNREISKEEFDRKVKENPSNDHLKVIIDDKDKDKNEETKEDNIKFNINPVKKGKSHITTFDLHPEIPKDNRFQFQILNDNLGEGTSREKFNRNIEAIKVLKKCEEQDRFATPEEQKILSQYVGWGGLSQVFDETNSSWNNEYYILKKLLDETEYAKARESTLTSFYTPPVVIRSIYKALENMGLKTGNILEPSCGIGNFIGMLPESLKKCKMYGVELDSISGRITRQLYQKSSIAVQGYEDTNLPDSFFDVAIGNVPFGNFKILDKKYDKHNFLIHDYFFAKTLDKVRPGGVVVFITSTGTLDKDNPSIRKYIAQRADLLGAIRLPNDTFKNNAGTEVTSDIIFLQKRDSITDIEPDWVYLGETENGIKMNQYFIDHPKMIMGNMEMVSTKFGYDSTCVSSGEDLEKKLEEAITNIHFEVKEYEIDDIDEEDNSIEADLTVRNFSYTLVDDKIYFRENSRMYPQELAMTTENRVKGLIEIRDCVRTLIEYQTQDYAEEDIKSQQVKLNQLYDDFTKKYGLINSRGNKSAFSDDSSYYLLCSLEILDENGNLERKADMFTKRTINPKIEIKSVDNANDALIVSISEKARVDLPFMQSLCGLDMDKMLSDLEGVIFNIPEYGEPNKWVTADEYLSGNVREKLKIAKEFAKQDPRFNINVKYLQQVMPKDLEPQEISVRLGATWIPSDIIDDFIDYLLSPSWNVKDNIKVHFLESTAQWNIAGKNYDSGNVKVYSTYGTSRINAYKIIEETLNLKDVRIYNYIYDEDGKRTTVLDKKETAIAQAKQEQIKTAFEEWIWNDVDRRERLSKIYNEKFNCNRPREYDGSHINFYGMNPEITLRKHQVNAIARILYGSNNTLLAHEVGAGKTFEMVAAAMESKRLGLCNKSMFVVPNHIVEQFASEFLQLYPSANILVTTKKDFETANRKKFCSRISTGDYDAVIISHSQFEKIPMSIGRQKSLLQNEINDISRGVQDLKANNGEKFTIKELEKLKKGLEIKLAKLNDTSRKDDVVTFEELGIDRLFVDEAHYFKNLFLYTKMRNVGGIAQTEAQKSSDLYMKCRYLDELTDGRGVVFATGTPVSNSMVELYTMQRYLQYRELEKRNLQHFDSWASTFGETVTAIEIAPEGTGYRAKTRFAKFYNLPELMAMFKDVADIQTADMLHLPLPEAHYETIVAKPTEIQKEMVKELSNRAEKVRNKEVDPSTDNMLKITNDGRKLALDQRLMNDMLPDDKESKVSLCANNIYKIWQEHKEEHLTQLVFCDLSTPNDEKFNVYDELKRKLQDLGIPEDEVEFVHNAHTDVQKKTLFSQVRNGIKRVLLGSTSKMGAGTNCQDKLIAIHNLDCPWRPADLTQRVGRILRQGNKNKEVYIYNYVTEGTFDAYLYQLVENKQRFISQIMTSKTPVRFAEDIDESALNYAQIKALAAGNPLIMEKTELDTQVAKLKLLKQNHLSQIYAMEDKVAKYYPSEIKRLESRVEGLKNDIEQVKNNTPNSEEKFQSMTINGVTYTDKKEAGNKILELCKNIEQVDKQEIGSYRGFILELKYDTLFKDFNLYLKNELSYRVTLGQDNLGNITRINNVLDGLVDELKDAEVELENIKIQFENAKEECKRPFKQDEELKQKSKRLDELNIKLNLNEKVKEIIDDGSEGVDNSQVYKREYAR